MVESRDQDELEQRADDLANAIFNPWSIRTRICNFIKTRLIWSLNLNYLVFSNKQIT